MEILVNPTFVPCFFSSYRYFVPVIRSEQFTDVLDMCEWVKPLSPSTDHPEHGTIVTVTVTPSHGLACCYDVMDYSGIALFMLMSPVFKTLQP